MNSSLSVQKPEYVLKRANDLINTATGSNKDKEKKWALEMLHNFIGVKRKVPQWTKVFEQLMKRHLELCVDLKDHHSAKDGLHQYRNLCQSMDPNSLEIVILHLMDLTEARATAARQKADKVALDAAAKISDLDQEESPESIMLSSMTEEGAKDRTDREVVVPWLKFLWETYRAVLELLHKIPKLEKVYHKTSEKAFKFCQDYARTLEFRRLCEMLRSHLANLQRLSVSPVRTNRPTWEWTPEAVELHLQTRFNQLEVATSLELWNEGFRTVEDIYSIMTIGRKTARPKLMSVYYEKLIRIFWVSGNYLFHAYAWFRYYTLVCEYRSKDIKQEERSMLASCVLLSALSIPSLKDFDATLVAIEDDETATEKHQQMATLLDFQANPTRKALLSDIVARGVLSEVTPELLQLYDLMETKFHPLSLVKSLVPMIKSIKANTQLDVYAVPLQRVAILRVLQQLAKVYSVVKIDFLQKLLSDLEDVSYNAVEKIMIDGVSRKQLSLRIDHRLKQIKFSVPTSSAAIDEQLSRVGADLNSVAIVIQTSLTSSEIEKASRKQFLALVASNADAENASTLDRKHLIEKRKIELEKIQDENAKLEKDKADLIEAQRIALEKQRLIQEQQMREKEKEDKIRDKKEVLHIQKELEKLGIFRDESELTAMDSTTRLGLLNDAKLEANKAREEEGKRVNEQARRLDHMTRALRIEAAEVVVRRCETQMREDKLAHDAKMEALQVQHKEEFMLNAEVKKRLTRLQLHREKFETEMLLADQKRFYDKQAAEMRKRALTEHRLRKIATARRLLSEEMERRREEEEAERERRDLERQIQIKAEEEKKNYEETRKTREAALELQLQIEKEQADRLAALEIARIAETARLKKLSQPAAAPAQLDSKQPAETDWRRPAPTTPTPIIFRGPPAQRAAPSEPWRPTRATAPAETAAPQRARAEDSWSRTAPPGANRRPESGSFTNRDAPSQANGPPLRRNPPTPSKGDEGGSWRKSTK